MAITYTNNLKSITDALETIINAEFKPIPVMVSDMFDSGYLGKGEYIRFWPVTDDEEAVVASGSINRYEVEFVWYFQADYYQKEKNIENVISPRMERLRQLLHNNRSYNSGATWYHLSCGSQYTYSLSEEVEEIEGLENIRAAKMTVNIFRGNFS